jgi:hypothetical protein
MNWLLKMDANTLSKYYWRPTYFILSTCLIFFISWKMGVPLAKYLLIASIIIVICYSFFFYITWAFTLGYQLFKRSNNLVPHNKLLYSLFIFSFVLFLVLGIAFIIYMRLFDLFGLSVLLCITIGLRFYIGTFLAKRIISIENQRNIRFNEYKNQIFSVQYFPHNIKLGHPRIQKLLRY